MYNDILVIADALVEPPSEVLPFRTVTMLTHDSLAMDILLQTTQDMKDIFYHWMKPRGMMDYIDYILNESEWEDSIRIDIVRCNAKTIVVRAIRVENHLYLLGRIKSLAGK
jgi:hypothetical protein